MEKEKKKSTAPISTTSEVITIKAIFVSADSIGVSYQSFPENQPNLYGNYLCVWENCDSIPPNEEPIKTQSIIGNDPMGSLVLDNLNTNSNDYLIGYSVGPPLSRGQKYGNVCSTVYVQKLSIGNQIDFQSKLTLISLDAHTVVVNYELPLNTTPEANGAWCGIWARKQPSYNILPEASRAISTNNSSGSIVMDGLNIRAGMFYTVAFFMSGWNGRNSHLSTMACSVTFQT